MEKKVFFSLKYISFLSKITVKIKLGIYEFHLSLVKGVLSIVSKIILEVFADLESNKRILPSAPVLMKVNLSCPNEISYTSLS